MDEPKERARAIIGDDTLQKRSSAGFAVVPWQMNDFQYQALSATDCAWRNLNSATVYRALVRAGAVNAP